jgi:hypothetical protein
MPFANREDFKATTTKTLDAYCHHYLFKPRRFTEATKLKEVIAEAKTQDEVLISIHSAYCNLLKQFSRDKLVSILALLMAEALDVDQKKTKDYLEFRNEMLGPFGVVDRPKSIKKIESFPVVHELLGVPIGQTEEKVDPVLAAFDERLRELYEVKLCF